MWSATSKDSSVPYWRLSSVYFFYFAVLGALLPYWSLFLESRGFDAKEIGWLSATIVCTRIVAPNIWGWLADHTQQRLLIIRLGALIGLLAFAGVFIAQGFFQLVLVLFIFSFFWNAILAQFEVVTLGSLGSRRQHYSQIRLWGSLGFILAVLALGILFDWISIDYLPQSIALLMLGVFLSSLFLPQQEDSYAITRPSQSVFSILRQPAVMCFFIITVLLQVSHAPYYVFFTIYLDHNGYSRALAGQLWALGVVAEIVLFIFMHQFTVRFSLRLIIVISLIITVLRWVITAFFVSSLPILIFAQCLHAFSFGTMHACSVEVVQRYFSSGHAGKGQALYSAASFGLGSAIGASIVGYLWAGFGATTTFLAAAAVAFAAFVIALLGVRGSEFN